MAELKRSQIDDDEVEDLVPAAIPRTPGKDEPRIKALVAHGRSVLVQIGEKQIVGYRPDDGKPIFAPALRYIKAGREVELPESEVVALRKSGYLVDPKQAPMVYAEGPRYTETKPVAKPGGVGYVSSSGAVSQQR